MDTSFISATSAANWSSLHFETVKCSKICRALKENSMSTVDALLHDEIDGHDSVIEKGVSGRTSTPGVKAIAPPSRFEWLFIITGGLIVALPLVWSMGEKALFSQSPINWYIWISALVSSPHVYATYVRLQRKINEHKAHWLTGFPLYFAIAGLLASASLAGLFVEVMTFINVWQSYHYVRQTYGIGCLYGRQVKFTEQDRRLRWWAYHLWFPALILGRWDTIYTAWQGKTYTFIPMYFGPIVMTMFWCLAGVGTLIALYAELRLMKNNGRNYSSVGFVNYMTCMAIHAYGFCFASHFQRGFLAVTIFHACQYMALVWWMERSTAIERGWRWAEKVPNFLGFALFWTALYFIGYSYEAKFSVAMNTFWIQASAILLASISAHHYTVDTFLWRRKVGK